MSQQVSNSNVTQKSEESIFAYYSLLDFFRYRNYKILNGYQDINESDFVFTMLKQEHMCRKRGRVYGLTLSFLFYDTLFANFMPLSKLLCCFILIKGAGELVVLNHINALGMPLTYIFNKYYTEKEA